MLHADLSETASSTNPIDLERLDTLTDVCSAINTTVNILDDLLTFEKMESGKRSHMDSPPSISHPALTLTLNLNLILKKRPSRNSRLDGVAFRRR